MVGESSAHDARARAVVPAATVALAVIAALLTPGRPLGADEHSASLHDPVPEDGAAITGDREPPAGSSHPQ
ncbi:MAG: hypothetical protein QOI48_3772 [Solirubrobacteraceae bacterium]|jgi:hypothetical protein|nr:hypothetical protein [Solirubrobacteraceae bacterium]